MLEDMKSRYESTYQHDFSTSAKGWQGPFQGRSQVRSMSASKMMTSPTVPTAKMAAVLGRPATRAAAREHKYVTVDGREAASTNVTNPLKLGAHIMQPQGVTVDGREVGKQETDRQVVDNLNLKPSSPYTSTAAANRPIVGVNLEGREVKMYPSGSGGAASRPLAWTTAAPAGSTKPPTVDNYVDSLGLNAGLGNASHTKFPSVVETRPLQAARMANYTRYSPADWSTSNMSNFNSADNARNNSERVRNEALRLMREREDKTVLTQRDADRRIGERLHDVAFWRSELQSELERNLNETHHLMETRKNLERALAETEGPLRITSECIYHREGRKGIDLVNDAPENALMKEIDVIKASQDRMRKTLEQVNYQLGLNRNARHQLERDLANKDVAIAIDHTCHQLQNTSRSINMHGGIEKMDPNITIPDTWAENSNHNIQESQGARSSSQRLRTDVDNLITQSANDMWSSWTNTNTSMQQRITETGDAHAKLQTHLAKTMQEIYDQEKHIQALKKAIRDKEAPLKVSQSRLEARSHRPDVELCRDPVHHRLVEEVQQIQESVDLLHRKLNEAELAHQDLLVNKARLEHDLKIKSNSLFIDREKCLAARKSFPVISLATKI